MTDRPIAPWKTAVGSRVADLNLRPQERKVPDQDRRENPDLAERRATVEGWDSYRIGCH